MNFQNTDRNDFEVISHHPSTAWFDKGKLLLNGIDRFQERDFSYFKYIQPYNYHTRIPNKDIYVYSFALEPEKLNPSGTCNFSRIDSATLELDSKGNDDDTFTLYAVNYNILRIESGMGGLMFSN